MDGYTGEVMIPPLHGCGVTPFTISDVCLFVSIKNRQASTELKKSTVHTPS